MLSSSSNITIIIINTFGLSEGGSVAANDLQSTMTFVVLYLHILQSIMTCESDAMIVASDDVHSQVVFSVHLCAPLLH